ncbi:MAG TPA: MFS transporter [Verrucomicrobiales bacterium]|jgi:MFS family permease|nr:MAG: MFS transporter [Verrucomicrobiaceae bacterium]HAN81838.1 MFS transporter [Verrucomicrobiales bacterium]|tara:strand:- start:2413 stop:3600 length:1188 start_codon:yes stop_codon:yes gene_type:complete
MKGHRYWLAVVFFLLASAPGFWFPALTNVLENYGLGSWAVWAFLVPPLAGMISPLIFGAQVDQRLEAQKVLGWIMLLGAGFLYMAFHSLEQSWGGWWFLSFFIINALISAPAWSLLTTITLSSLADPGKTFGLFRVWGTLGWMASSLLVSLWGLDFSAETGKLGAGVRVFAGISCFLLPVTLPKGDKPKKWTDNLGLGALKLLHDRDLFIYFSTALLFSIPLGAYYLHTPKHLKELGVESVSAFMATAQVMETIAMLLMGWVIARFRVKTILLFAIGSGVLRYTFYAFDEVTWLVIGITLHGFCWTFFFEAGRVFVHRRVDEGMRTQAQALLGFFTGGLGTVLGILTVDRLYHLLAPSWGWSGYWAVLTGMNCLALTLFAFGYKGLPINSGIKDH